MKIALFMPAFSGGGSARVMLTLAGAFRDAGHDVDLVVTRARGDFVGEEPEGVHLVDLDASRIITAFPGLVRYLRGTKPDAMLSALAPANCLAVWARKLAGVDTRVVVSEHNTLSIATAEADNWRKRLMPRIMRPSYRHADAVVAVSGGVADDLAAVIGLPRERIRVIHNPVVTTELKAQAAEQVQHPWLGESEPPVILGVGRLIPQKDFSTLIRAFARVRAEQPARLMILGEGPERTSLEALVRELGLENAVELPGFVTNPYAYMNAASFFVLSSRWEGFGNVLVEAMACDTPVVSTDCPSGPAEILEGGRWGALVPVGDTEAMAEAIRHPPRGEALRPRVRATAFSPESAGSTYLDVLEEIA